MWGRLHSKFLDVPSAELVSAEHVIGRGQHCHTKLPNDRCVSNKHCCVGRDVAAGCSTLTDTSTNGTYLNKKKVGKGKVVPLQSGDVITVLLSTNTEISFVFKAVDSGGPLDGSSGPCKQQKSTPQRTRCGSGSGDEGRRRLRSSAAVEQRHGSHCVDAPSEPGETPSRRHSAAGHAEAATGRSTDLTAQYTIVRTLGTGTFAEVKLAVDKRTGEEVAIKIIAKKTLSSPKAAATSAANMWREVDILKQLSHEGIVGVRDVFDAPDSLSLVLDLARGGELFDLIRERQYFSEAEAKTIFRQLGYAVCSVWCILLLHCMYAECILSLEYITCTACILCIYTLCVSYVCTACMLCVDCVYVVCIWCVFCAHTACTIYYILHVCCVYDVCILCLLSILQECCMCCAGKLHLYRVDTACMLHEDCVYYCMYALCLLCIYFVYIVCILPLCCAYAARTFCVYCVYTECAWHVYCTYAVCSVSTFGVYCFCTACTLNAYLVWSTLLMLHANCVHIVCFLCVYCMYAV